MMFETILSEVLQFLSHWNNDEQADANGFRPINGYNLHALSVGFGFTLKWYICKRDFDRIAAEIEYVFPEGQTNKIILLYGETRIEFEIDTLSILDQEKEELQEIEKIVAELKLPDQH